MIRGQRRLDYTGIPKEEADDLRRRLLNARNYRRRAEQDYRYALRSPYKDATPYHLKWREWCEKVETLTRAVEAAAARAQEAS